MERDRTEAGRALAGVLGRLAGLDPVVVGLPPGAVPIAYEVARGLQAPMDVLVVSRLRPPGRPDLAIGAVAEDGTCVVNEPLAGILGLSATALAHIKGRARDDLARQVLALRNGHPMVPVEGRLVLIVDDGLLTGSSAATAARVARSRGAERVVVASPHATEEGAETVRSEADELVLLTPEHPIDSLPSLFSGGPVTEQQALALLDRARATARAS